MYDDGAEVVFAAAGESGLGVIEAAAAESTATRHLWAIGVDSDQYETVQWLPGVVEPARWQAHILTSVTKSLDANIYDVVADHSRGRLNLNPPGRGVG
jgi:basic membrane protein A